MFFRKFSLFLLFIVYFFFVFITGVFAEENTLPCCGTDNRTVKELHNNLIQKRLNKAYNTCHNEISLFSTISDSKKTNGGMPSTGNVKALVITLSFPNAPFTNEQFEMFKDQICGIHADAQSSLFYCHQDERSVAEIYSDISNGKLNFSADMMPVYQAPNHQYYYAKNDPGLDNLLTDVLTHYKKNGDIKDFSEYDSDNDGNIDCLIVAHNYVTINDEKIEDEDTEYEEWRSHVQGTSIKEIDGVKISHRAQVSVVTPKSGVVFIEDSRYSVIHECGHLMGLDDNYLANGYENTLYGTNEIMCGGYYFNAYYRYLLDWIKPKILSYKNQIETIDLTMYENVNNKKEQAIILIPDSRTLPFAEYYIVEYRKDLIRKSLYTEDIPPVDTTKSGFLVEHKDGGVILWHVKSEMNNSNGQYLNKENYIKPVYKNGGIMQPKGIYYQEDDVYRTGDIFSPTTTPSSDFYDGYKTGAYLEVVGMDEEKATVKVGFQDMNWEQPTVSITGRNEYTNKYGRVCFSLAYDNVYTIMGNKPTASDRDTVKLSKEMIDKFIEISTTEDLQVQIDYEHCFLRQNKVYIWVKGIDKDAIEGDGEVQLHLKEGSATNGFNKKCEAASCSVTTPDFTPPIGTITYSTDPITGIVTATLTVSEEIQPIEMTHDFYRNGSYTFEFYDLAGNKGTATAAVDWIDREPMTVKVEYSTTEPTNQDVIVTIKPSEEVQETPDELTHIFTDNGSYTFTYTDIYGNPFKETVEVNWIDRRVPTFMAYFSTDDRTARLKGPVIARISYFEALKPFERLHVFEENGSWTYQAEDLAGNVGTGTATVNWIEKNNPLAEIRYSTTDWINQDVTVTIIPFYGVNKGKEIIYTRTDDSLLRISVPDESGVEKYFNVKVLWIDKTPPQIELNGDSEITLEFGEEYIEQGAKVTDNSNTPIQDRLEITGNVDTSKPGTYEIRYNVTDLAGNSAEEKVRTVTVLEPPKYAVTLNTNGGTVETDITEYTYGTGAKLPIPAKVGYMFDGWYDNAGFTGEPITQITSEDTGDKTYYTKWSECKHSSCTENVVLKASCTQTGKKTVTCTICKASWTEITEMLPHKEVKDPAVEANCETEGKTDGSHCSACGKILTAQEIVPETGHKFNENEWQTDNDKHWHECGVCHEIIGEATHIKDGGTVTKQPTTEETGTREYRCTVCKYLMQSEVIDKLPPEHTHSYDAWKYDGETHWHECECGEKQTAEPHNLVSAVTKKATCTETGVKTFTCECGYTTTEEISKLPHTIVTDAAVAPTCETVGKTEGSHCDVCNTVIVEQRELDAIGHDWSEWSITKEPTLTDTGEAEHVCRNDNSQKDITKIPNLSNTDVWTEGKYIAPTEEKQGSQEYISEYGTVTVVIPTLPRSDRVEFTHLSNGNILAELIFNKTMPPENDDIWVFIAFKKDGILQSVQMPKLTNFTTLFAIPDQFKDYDISVYVWDKNMKPLMETQEFEWKIL